MIHIRSCGLASYVRVYADRAVLEKPVEDGFDDNYDNNYTDDDNDNNAYKVAGDDEEPVEDGGGR